MKKFLSVASDAETKYWSFQIETASLSDITLSDRWGFDMHVSDFFPFCPILTNTYTLHDNEKATKHVYSIALYNCALKCIHGE